MRAAHDRLLIVPWRQVDEIVDIALQHRRLRRDRARRVPVAGIAPEALRPRLDRVEPRLHILADRGEQDGAHPVAFLRGDPRGSLGLEPRAFQCQRPLVEQVAELLRLKCEFGQGLLFSKPLSPAGVGALLRSSNR